jgi:hypothetical protein
MKKENIEDAWAGEKDEDEDENQDEKSVQKGGATVAADLVLS